jgi:hypothetical protein
MRGSRILVGLLVASGCGTFGASETGSGGPPPTPPTDAGDDSAATDAGGVDALSLVSVVCGEGTCTDGRPCCITGSPTPSCAEGERCPQGERPIYCDDGADCAALGQACCLELALNADGESGTPRAATCQLPSKCLPDAPAPGGTTASLRVCDPRPGTSDCEGRSCVSISTRFPVLNPAVDVSVCAP